MAQNIAILLPALNVTKEEVCYRYQIPEDWPYQEARRLFKEPNATIDIPELKWTAPDEEGLISFLVKDNGFNKDRVTKAIEKIKSTRNKSSQGRLEFFFNPVATTSAPLQRKVPPENETSDKTRRLRTGTKGSGKKK